MGVPIKLLTDGAPELVKGEWSKICKRHFIHQRATEPHSPWQNPAELSDGIVKRRVRNLMKKTNTPIRLRDYCWCYVSDLRSITATRHLYLDDVTHFEKVHGYTPNISEFLSFKWFQWVLYQDPDSPTKAELGRWLGPAHDICQGMAYHILTRDGTVVTRSTVSQLSPADKISQDILKQQESFTNGVDDSIGNFSSTTLKHVSGDMLGDDIYDNIFKDFDPEACVYDENGDLITFSPMDNPQESEAPVLEQGDQLIGTKIQLPLSGELREATVVQRKRNFDGTLVGTANPNPILDSRQYDVDFGDELYQEYSANVLLENLYSQVDEDGQSSSLLQCIVDHRCTDAAVPKEEGWYNPAGSTARKRVRTTKGWDIQVEWTDGTRTWVSLKDLKEANPIDLAEYAKARGIDDEPAFAWWVNWTLKKRDMIINNIRARIPKKAMKFGVVVPGSVDEAIKLDEKNGNDFWKNAIVKELKNVIIAFRLLEPDEHLPVGSKEIPYHIVFDVKFDLTGKARLVAGGHRHKDVPARTTFSTVASRDSVRIGFLIAALNDLDIMACDIGNASLNAPNRERVHVTVGKELFGPEHEGKRAVVVRALYGLKSASAAWRHHFAATIINDLGYKSTIADPEVYFKPKVKSDGTKYYAYRYQS